jgi:hypothetical protein
MDKDINKLIEEIFKIDPIDLSTQTGLSEEMKQGLAFAYSNQGFRKYLELAVNNFIVSSAIRATDWDGVQYRRGAIIALKQLLSLSKESYMSINKKMANKL